MKTKTLLLMFFALLAKAQEFPRFEIQKPGVSVIVKETIVSTEDQKKIDQLQSCFEEAIKAFLETLQSDEENALKKMMGPFLSSGGIKTLSRVNYTVMVLAKDDSQDRPITFRLPQIFDHNESFVTRIPYKFIEKAGDRTYLEWTALYQVSGVIIGALGGDAGRSFDEMAKEYHYIQCNIYALVGEKRYRELLTARVGIDNPKESEEWIKNTVNLWVNSLGMKK